VVANPCDSVSRSVHLTHDDNNVLGSACHVERMTSDDTSSWIWRYCHNQGWDEAAYYAENFKEQEITGRVLKDLSDRDLKISLKIMNPSHRNGLLYAIQNLFPSPTVGANMEPRVQSSVSKLAFPCPIVYLHPAYLVPYPESSVCSNHNVFSTGISVDQSLESSAFGNPITGSSVSGQSGCESSISQYTWVPNTIGVRSDSDDATMASQGSSFGTDLAKYEDEHVSDMVSDSNYSKQSCPAQFTDINGPNLPFGNMFNSTIQIHGRKTSDIEKINEHVLQGPQMRRSKPISPKRSRCGNYKKLLLILDPDQIPENGDPDIVRSWFVKVDSGVKVKPMDAGPSIYTLIFQSEEAGKEALKFRRKGFKIKMKYPRRARPSSPVEYKVLRDLQVRQGKSFKGNYLVGILKRGETVEVDQIKGRRARVVNRGWVSLKTENGIQLLQRVSDS